MAQLAAFWAKLTMLVSTIRFSDIVDILIVAYLIYNVIMLIRKANSYRLAQGVLLILIALWLSGVLKLTMFNRILQKTVELGLIALVIIFQPELRRLLERMGSKALPSFGAKPLETLGMDNVISQTIAACTQLSTTKTGALIVFERSVTLDEQMRSGTTINSDVTAELLKNIFYPKAPLHDGAVVIRDGRIAAAGCVLPLTNNTNLSHAPPRGHRYERAFGCRDRDRVRGDRRHFHRRGRHAQAPPFSGDVRGDPPQRAAAGGRAAAQTLGHLCRFREETQSASSGETT